MPVSGSRVQHARPGLITRPEGGSVCHGPTSGPCEYSHSGTFSCSIASSCASECVNIDILWMAMWASGGGYLRAWGTPEELRDRP